MNPELFPLVQRTVTIKRQREAANKERDGGKYIKREWDKKKSEGEWREIPCFHPLIFLNPPFNFAFTLKGPGGHCLHPPPCYIRSMQNKHTQIHSDSELNDIHSFITQLCLWIPIVGSFCVRKQKKRQCSSTAGIWEEGRVNKREWAADAERLTKQLFFCLFVFKGDAAVVTCNFFFSLPA